MALNLLDSRNGFEVKISADCPSQPGWEPENLISAWSSSSAAGRGGFMAAYFKKPPVTITVSFVHPAVIQIQKIVFCPRIKSQSFLAVNVLVRRRSKPQRIIEIVKASWEAGTETVIFDGSPHYRSHGILPAVGDHDSRSHKWPRDVRKCRVFKLPRHAALGDVEEVILTITRTHASTAVAMDSLAIFGQPSLLIGRHAYQIFASSIATSCLNGITPVELTPSSSTLPSDNREEDYVVEVGDSKPIPAAYQDPLTLHLMKDPVVLPSGNILDMSSLKRHEAAQTELGRQLFDPFTGSSLSYSQVRSHPTLRQEIVTFHKANQSNDPHL